jgi:hypothetical protein
VAVAAVVDFAFAGEGRHFTESAHSIENFWAGRRREMAEPCGADAGGCGCSVGCAVRGCAGRRCGSKGGRGDGYTIRVVRTVRRGRS